MTEMTDVSKEVVEVLNHFDKSFVWKISPNFLDNLRELARESKKEIRLEANKKLSEQNISNQAKNCIALIYYEYIANAEEKQKIMSIWEQNEKEYLEKYNIENIFK